MVFKLHRKYWKGTYLSRPAIRIHQLPDVTVYVRTITEIYEFRIDLVDATRKAVEWRSSPRS